MDLDSLAAAELLKEAQRGKQRSETMGAFGWCKPRMKPNRVFLQNIVMPAVKERRINIQSNRYEQNAKRKKSSQRKESMSPPHKTCNMDNAESTRSSSKAEILQEKMEKVKGRRRHEDGDNSSKIILSEKEVTVVADTSDDVDSVDQLGVGKEFSEDKMVARDERISKDGCKMKHLASQIRQVHKKRKHKHKEKDKDLKKRHRKHKKHKR